MPKQKKKMETTTEFQKREFPSRVRAAERRAQRVLDNRGAPRADRIAARKVIQATGRVKKRLGIGGTKKTGPKQTAVRKSVFGALMEFAKNVGEAPSKVSRSISPKRKRK